MFSSSSISSPSSEDVICTDDCLDGLTLSVLLVLPVLGVSWSLDSAESAFRPSSSKRALPNPRENGHAIFSPYCLPNLARPPSCLPTLTQFSSISAQSALPISRAFWLSVPTELRAQPASINHIQLGYFAPRSLLRPIVSSPAKPFEKLLFFARVNLIYRSPLSEPSPQSQTRYTLRSHFFIVYKSPLLSIRRAVKYNSSLS